MTEHSLRRHLARQSWHVVSITSLVIGCSDPGMHLSQTRDGVIYGQDTRRDVYAVDDPQLAQFATQSTVAFISDEHLTSTSDGRLEILVNTLGESNNLCPGEAFITQPTAATCSGVLIDDQLVLTAAHCISDAGCNDQQLVFGYAVTAPGGPVAVDAAATYRCKSVPVRRLGRDSDGRHLDYAVIELDRPVDSARRPVETVSEVPPIGGNVAVIGFPSGLPVKVDSAAQVLYVRPCRDYFTISSDTFQASSGSGVFDDRGRLVGSFVRGGVDYEFVPTRGCAVARRIASIDDPADAEQASYVGPAITALCASGWVSAKLCPAAEDQAQVSCSDAASCAPEVGCDGVASGCSAARHGGSVGTIVTALALVLMRRRLRSARLTG